MTARSSAAAPSATYMVRLERVFDHAVEQIMAATRELWPDEPVRLGEHVPSATSYVRLIRAGRRRLLAKYNVLGVPLAAVLRITQARWDRVLAAQASYVASGDTLLAREAGQLQMLSERHPLRTCRLAGYRNGVLFTKAVTFGMPLDKLLLAEPQHAAELLRRVWTPLARLSREPMDSGPLMPERDIATSFAKRFLGEPVSGQLGQLGRGVDPEVVTGLRYVVRRLRVLPATWRTNTPAFGGARPDRIILTGAEPVYLDPGIHLASSPSADLATLASRVLLFVLARVSAISARRHILAALTDLVGEQRSAAPLASSGAWMTDLLTLVVRDMVNLLTTYLAAPPRFPLPREATAVASSAATVVPILEHVMTGVAQRIHAVEIWERLLAEVGES